MKLKWLHLSDLHFILGDYNSTQLRKRLLRYLEDNNIECDFVAITGDIFYQYNYNNDYMKIISDFILELISKVKVDSKNLFIVPGNHDLNRNDYDRKILIKAIKSEKERQYNEMNNVPDEKIRQLMGTYKYFYEFLKVVNNEGEKHFNEVHYAIEREKFNILNLNTCLTYSEEYQDNLLICQSRIPEKIEEWEHNDKVNIVLSHYGIDMLEKIQKEKLTNHLSNCGIDVYLCGHVHEPNFDNIYDKNNINVFVSGSNYVDNFSTPSFILNEVDLNTYEGIAQLHVWNKKNDFWEPANSRIYPNGIREYKIDRLKKKIEKINEKVYEEYALSMDFIPYNLKQKDSDNILITNINNDIVVNNKKHVDFEKNALANMIEGIYINNIDYLRKENKHINLMSKKEYFLKYADTFRKFTINILKDSNKFYEIESNFTQIILLGNRIMELSRHDSEYHLSFEIIMSSVKNMLDYPEKESTKLFIGEFIEFVSNWIKNLGRVLYTDDINEYINEDASKLSLFGSKVTRGETDRLEKTCFKMISDINNYKNSNRIIDTDFYRIVENGLVTILYSIYVNKQKIIQKIQNLIISDTDDEEVLILLKMITDEQKKYVKRFRGREEYISKIYKEIFDNNFTVLHGKEQCGKSSILSKIVERIQSKEESINKNVEKIMDSAPWLSSVLYHSGKQSSNVQEMMKSIVYQANAKLVDKINIDKVKINSYESYKRTIQEILSKLIVECGHAILILDGIDNLIRNLDDIELIPEDIPEKATVIISLRSNSEGVRLLKKYRQVKLIELNDISRDEIYLFTNINDEDKNQTGKSINDEIYNKFSNKPGKIIELSKKIKVKNEKYTLENIYIDDNEMFLEDCRRWSKINFKFKSISEELLALLAIFKPLEPLDIEWIQLYFKYKNIDYKLPFYRDLLYNVKNQIEGIDLNKVSLINRALSEYVINFYFSRLDLEIYIDNIFYWFKNDKNISTKLICRFMDYWMESKRLGVGFFKDKAYGFLNYLKYKNESNLLFNISSTILNEGLKIKDIAVEGFELCLLLDNDSLKIKYSLRLIDGNGLDSDITKGEKILEQLALKGNREALFILGQKILFNTKNSLDLEKGKKYLMESAQLGFIAAKTLLGGLLLEGYKIDMNHELAFEYLEDSVQNGDVLAKVFLGDSLIHGYSKKQDIKRGENLLREACSLGNKKAKEILANRLINGYGIQQDIVGGEKLLRELVDEGEEDAVVNLANRLIDGIVLKQDVEEGVNLLYKAFELGNIEAKKSLADRLLDGRGINKNVEEGEKILRELVDSNEDESKLNLANRLIDGISIKINRHEGVVLLKELVESDYEPSKIEFSNRLIDNDGIEKNVELGEKILRDVAKTGNKKANIILAKRLIYGDGIVKNIYEGIEILKYLSIEGVDTATIELALAFIEEKCGEQYEGEGEDLLRKVASSGNFQAKFNLARKLLSDDKIKKDVYEAEKILKELTELGYDDARIFYANELFSGKKIRRNRIKGESLLKKASDNGQVIAKYYLGSRLIIGEGIRKDIEEGEKLLRQAIDAGFVEAKYSLGEKIIDGIALTRDVEEGKKLLYDAISLGSSNAKLSVSLRLLDGDVLVRDKDKGELLLREVALEGNNKAKIILANRLIGGVGLDKNENEGIQLLQDMVEEGNNEAKYILSINLLEGYGVPRDTKRGGGLLESSAQYYSKAKIELANRLIDGDGIEKDVNKGIKMFEELAESNDLKGKCEYAKRLIDQEDEIKDLDKGINILYEIVNDYDEAKFILACELLDGNNVIFNEDEGEKMLRELSEENYSLAKLELGRRLINADKINYDFEKGANLLRELISEGSILAAQTLAKGYLYDMYENNNRNEGIRILKEIVSNDNDEWIKNKSFECARTHKILSDYFYTKSDVNSKGLGEKHLKAAVRLELSSAIYELGLRYIEGNGVKKSISKGQKKLKKAADMNNLSAQYELGRRMKYGIKIKKNVNLGEKNINKVIDEATGSQLRDIGFEYYNRQEFEDATYLFNKSFEKGYKIAGNDLSYMLRRNEVKGEIIVKDIEILLEEGLRLKQRVNIINYALCYAYGFQKEKDWNKADQIISKIDKVNNTATWWYDLSLSGDIEGDLVIGWLARHGIIKDPDGLSVKERMDKVRTAGFKIPEWMNEISNI